MVNPLLTLVIVNYNQGKYFEDCLRPIVQQAFKDFKLIVIDDCSVDDSVHQIRTVLDQYGAAAHFIVNKKNQGICANLNMALQMATGNYFSFIASDDWVDDTCYESMVRTIEAAGEKVATVYGDCKVVDEDKHLLYPSYMKFYRPDLKQPPTGNVYYDLLKGNFIPAMVTTTKMSILKQLGGFDERLKVEDYDMFLRIAKSYDFLFDPNANASYRVLPNSLIRRIGARKYEDWIDMYLKHTDTDKQALVIIRQKLLNSCEFLYYTDSEKLEYYLKKCNPYIPVTGKLRLLVFLKKLGIKGSTFKKWSNKLQGRK